jgi:pSer/pThr/pTyr-binding forkhead associated (FHA) protein
VPYLIYEPETPNETIHQLRFGINSIGREKDNSIVIIHGNLSRQHAELTIGYNRAVITDLRSLNGTFVNEVKIDRCELKDGDWIRCGSVVFKYVDKLRSLEPESLSDNDGVSIIKQVSREPTHMAMQDLLVEDGTNGSVIKLRQHNIGQRAVDKLKILLEVSKQLSSPEEPERLLEKILTCC